MVAFVVYSLVLILGLALVQGLALVLCCRWLASVLGLVLLIVTGIGAGAGVIGAGAGIIVAGWHWCWD